VGLKISTNRLPTVKWEEMNLGLLLFRKGGFVFITNDVDDLGRILAANATFGMIPTYTVLPYTV